jgi:CubicO group peptidase (beta-lactamase class C family)
MSVSNPLTNLQAYVESALVTHNIPAISLAVWKDNTLHQAAAGCLNIETGQPATVDTVFQIGSITKVMTTSLIMQLVDEGRVDLDTPIKHYLRDFIIADADATHSITVRQLVSHTNGMAGDFFPDDRGHEGNLIARYVDRCNLLPLVHPPGKMYSYSNSAFAIAGRLIEVMRGMTWYQAMDEYLFAPLGMKHALADPKDMIRFCAAAGHVYANGDSDRWALPDNPYLSLGQAAVGATPAMSAENLIRFARAHMEGGNNQQGEPWLSSASVAAMQSPQIEVPRGSQLFRKYAGLGWGFSEYHPPNPLKVAGHGGGTQGFLSMLQMVPEQNAAIAILTNGYRPSAIEGLTSDLLGVIADIDLQQPEPQSQAGVEQLSPIVGVYESFDTHITVSQQDQTFHVEIIYKIDPLPPLHLELRHMQDDDLGEFTFAPYTDEGRRVPAIVFLAVDEQGAPQYLYNGGRQNRRIA